AIAFLFAGIFIADIATRERRAGTLGFVYSAPLLQPRYVAWKFIASLFVALTMLAFPLARAAMTHPASAIAIIVALLFVCAAATSLGVMSGNPKAFIVLFLTFWYIAVNDKGVNPSLDFAGFFNTPPVSVMAAYSAIAVLFIVAAEAMHRRQLATV